MFAFGYLVGKVTVGGSVASTISGSGPNSGYHLAYSTTFDVARTSNQDVLFADLLVSGNLIDNFADNVDGSLIKTGAGTMTLTGKNTYKGSTTINGGILNVGDVLSTGTGSSLGNGTGTVTVNQGGRLWFWGNSSAGNTAITNNAGGTINFSVYSTAGNSTINNASGAINFRAGDIGLTGSVTAGSARITNNSGGVITFDNGTTAGGATITNNSGLVTFQGSAGSASIVNNAQIAFAGIGWADNSTIANNKGGTITFTGYGSGGYANITNNNGGSITFSDASSGGYANITNNNGGSIIFTGNSSGGYANITNNSQLDFTGSSSADRATISNNALLNFLNTSAADNAAIRNDGILSLNQHSGPLAIGALSGAGNVLLGSNTLTVGGLNTSGTVSGVISGAGGLIKTGTGTLTLTGNNTYSGGTKINAGTVAAQGNALGTGAVTVANGATLAVGEAPNTSLLAQTTGTLTLSSLSVTVGGTAPLLTFNLGNSGISDKLILTSVTNPMTFSSAVSGGSNDFVIGFASATGSSLQAGTYTLFSFATAQAQNLLPSLTNYKARPMGNLGSLVTDNGAFGYIVDGNGSVTGLSFTLEGADLVVTPEPGALSLILFALPMSIVVLRRTRTLPSSREEKN